MTPAGPAPAAPPGLTYREAGATRAGPLPPGYRHLRVRTLVGYGPGAFAAARAAVMDWRMHRAVGVTIETAGPVAVPGLRVVVGLGAGRLRLRAPCAVVWTMAEERRAGFGYGTLRGHPQAGEEAFAVSLEQDASVVLTVTAFSRPAAWYTRAAGPLVPAFQRAYARRCGRVLLRLVRE
ncbi:DUF1990 domain-containing protein [Streptomyces sp. B1866]|uniref:DUF1990 family protein n=1 Tax=Streptomyces sp. B1866 TaxID=3075431 RepID=UPI00288DCD3F|nr:DUF1990 domain-containing protein [Streptomyces sp. B1866]MDT3400693.1 DUF1990 domain-containing protein [Streptomyces sp. B1866]